MASPAPKQAMTCSRAEFTRSPNVRSSVELNRSFWLVPLKPKIGLDQRIIDGLKPVVAVAPEPKPQPQRCCWNAVTPRKYTFFPPVPSRFEMSGFRFQSVFVAGVRLFQFQPKLS